MTYKYFSQEIEPFQLTNGTIIKIAVGQMRNKANKQWLVDIDFIGKTTNDETWHYVMTITMPDYKEFYIESIVAFLNYNKDKVERSSIFAFKKQMDKKDILNNERLMKLFTTKNAKVK